MRSFVVPGRLPTLNAWRNQHYLAKNKDKKYWQAQIILSLTATHVPKPLKWPVVLKAVVCTKAKRDVDGGILASKFLGDALVEGGWLPNDGPEYVQAVELRWNKAKDDAAEQVEYRILETI